MNYELFQTICESCYITRKEVEETYNKNPKKPWACDYCEHERITDAHNFLEGLFQDEEIDLRQISGYISEYRKKNKSIKGYFWGTMGNLSVTIAKTAANSFIKYAKLLPDVEINLEEIMKEKPSPYGAMTSPNFCRKPDGDFEIEGTHSADYEAASMMYEGNLLALMIAREYNFEEYLP